MMGNSIRSERNVGGKVNKKFPSVGFRRDERRPEFILRFPQGCRDAVSRQGWEGGTQGARERAQGGGTNSPTLTTSSAVSAPRGHSETSPWPSRCLTVSSWEIIQAELNLTQDETEGGLQERSRVPPGGRGGRDRGHVHAQMQGGRVSLQSCRVGGLEE